MYYFPEATCLCFTFCFVTCFDFCFYSCFTLLLPYLFLCFAPSFIFFSALHFLIGFTFCFILCFTTCFDLCFVLCHLLLHFFLSLRPVSLSHSLLLLLLQCLFCLMLRSLVRLHTLPYIFLSLLILALFRTFLLLILLFSIYNSLSLLLPASVSASLPASLARPKLTLPEAGVGWQVLLICIFPSVLKPPPARRKCRLSWTLLKRGIKDDGGGLGDEWVGWWVGCAWVQSWWGMRERDKKGGKEREWENEAE